MDEFTPVWNGRVWAPTRRYADCATCGHYIHWHFGISQWVHDDADRDAYDRAGNIHEAQPQP